jgi:type I restriction enzyme S subunit
VSSDSNSPFPWCAPLPPSWDRCALKYCAGMKGRLGWQNLRAEEYTDKGPFLVTSEHFDNDRIDWSRSFHVTEERYAQAPEIQLRTNDVLVMKDGAAMGKLAYVDNLPGPACLNSHLLLFRPLEGRFVPRFLYYVLRSPLFQEFIGIEATGTTFLGVSQESIRTFPLPLPAIHQQTAIADFLDRETARLDALVAEKERWLELLAEKRRALITHAVTRGLRNESLPLIRLKWLLDGIDAGFTPDSYNYPADEGQHGVLKSGCVNGGIFDPDENKLLADNVEPPDSLKVNRGDILMSRASGSSALIGSVARVHKQPGPTLYLSDKTFRLRVKESDCDGGFLVWAMGSTFLREQLSQIISGAEGLAKNIPQSEIRELLMPHPPLTEQRAIVAHISAETGKIDALRAATERTIALLKERRAALIAAVVTGKIQV